MSVEDRLHTLERLLEVTRGINSALDSEPYLQTLIAAGSELTGSAWCSILEFEETGSQLRFVTVPWFHRDTLQKVSVPLSGSITGQAFKDGRPLVVNDVAADGRHFKGVDLATGVQTRSVLAVPLIFKDQSLGVFEAINKSGDAHYTGEDVTVLETLAAQASIIFYNHRLQKRAQSAYEELADLDRMKSDFIAIASHELRTPLGLILGHSTFLRELVDEQYRDQLDTIVRNATRLKEIIDNLSSVDNFQSGLARLRRQKISLARIIDDVVASYREDAAEKKVTLTVQQPHDPLQVDADGDKIAVALSNLVKNAISFTDPGGQVAVVSDLQAGNVKVSVIDNGIGIPAKDLPRIFERFYQVESHLTRRHGGMGLGLSVAKVMIEMHGGKIWAESIEGKGTNFSFTLPAGGDQPSKSAEHVFIS
jgi:signal transduction histidine kinase